MDAHQAQAMIRFGLGRRGEEKLPTDPGAWLAGQLDRPDPGLALATHSSADGLAALRQFRQMMQARKQAAKAPAAPAGKPRPPGMVNPIRRVYVADAQLALDHMLETDAPFRERLVWFWANHFTVSLRRGFCAAVAVSFVQEAIRPHVTGRFVDMVLAVMRHPAMLLYLDNAQSIGPDSPAGRRTHRGLNENLARECMELHTVTPAAGYTQADVTAFARVLTGWSINFQANPPGFMYRRFAHEPGAQTVMGQHFAGGEEAGVAALTWLADHPATHHHLARRLVQHFVADTPPVDAVARVEGVLRDTRGDLKAASLELIRLPGAWQPLTKLRQPADYVVGVLRAVDLPQARRPGLLASMAGLGQPFFTAPLPNGWPDTAADWAGPETMLRRIDWSFEVAGRAAMRDPAAVARASLGGLLPPATFEQVARAGSRREGMTLLLAAPEFQRR
ncbi:MAG: DUF1800 domain-containing protein [Rhodospirillales bacterium]|nr:DUF1800 domain-containing protein [Rhodospirillales bacterium]